MWALEFFMLRDAIRESRALAEEPRRAAAEALDGSTRAAAQAESLWAANVRHVGYRYAREALAKALEGARLLDADLEPLVGESWVRRIERAEDAAGLALPETREALADLHGQHYIDALACARRLVAALADRARSPEELLKVRRARALATLAVVALFSAFLAYQVRFDPRPFVVDASAYRTADVVEAWPPENAADRDEMSYWHLPDGQIGWIDLHLTPPRDVTAIRLMNAHDLHADDQNRYDRRRFDRASRQIHVHAYSGGREVASVERELPRLRALDRETIPLEAHAVDRIRIDINSFWGVGGGLAEIEVLP